MHEADAKGGARQPERGDLVVAARATTLAQADVIRVSLEAAGIPAFVYNELASNWLMHMAPAIHPRGVKVMVLPEHAHAAREVLRRPPEAPPPAEPGEETEEEAAHGAATVGASPDACAERAYRAALYCPWTLWLFLPAVAYYFLQAMRARGRRPAAHPGRYARHMVIAFLVGIAPALALAGLILSAAFAGC